MIEEHKAPISILGVPLKTLVVALIFLLSLVVVFDRLDFKRFAPDDSSPKPPVNISKEIVPQPDTNDIMATPEMISKAMKEVQIEKLQQIETTENILPTDRFYYIIELTSGGDLEAIDVSIDPDTVTLSSSSGVTTAIPRNSVKKISRFKLPPLQPKG